MASLGDYLGHLLSEISKARVHADMESIKIAQIYANDDLLKTFPVPRVRLPNIELNVPVIVEKANMENIYSTKSIDKRNLVNATYTVLRDKLAKSYKKEFSRKEYIHIARKIYAETEKITKKDTIHEEINMAKSTFINEVITDLNKTKNIRPSKKNSVFNKEIKRDLEDVLLVNLKSPFEKLKSISIAPETFKQKELGDTMKSLTLKLSITEDAIEWVETENEDGEKRVILVSE